MDDATPSEAKTPGYLVKKRGRDGLVYLAVVGWNNETVLSSEGHHNEGDVDDVAAKFFPDWPVNSIDLSR